MSLAASADFVLEARGVSRRYPGTLALDNVDFQIRKGAVHALIGENGAGKSTLVRILAGADQPTSGALYLDGKEIRLRSVRDADSLGIGIIYQELNLCPNLSVAENIFLAREMTSKGMLNRAAEGQRAKDLLAKLEHPIEPGVLVESLPLGQQQIVEIAKALARDVRVLMMDEPTSALSASEIEVLFRIIRELTSRGVSIVYISHRLEELLGIADYVTVLRDGRLVESAAAAEVDVNWIVERMTGRSGHAAAEAHEAGAGHNVLRVAGLSLFENGRTVLQDISLNLQAGEVLGIYGLMGAGRTELMECLMGLRRAATGTVALGERGIEALGIQARIAAGLAMVPEDRQGAGLVQTLTVCANITLASLGKFAIGPFLAGHREEAGAAPLVADLRIKTAGLQSPIGSLSGGNQQKVVIAKCLLTSPRVLLMDEPSRGVDVAAKAEIRALVRRLASAGMGVVYVSSELAEVRDVADRVLVMSRGRITGTFQARHATDEQLVAAASLNPDR